MNVLDPQGPIGAAEKTILINSLAIMLSIIVPTIVATLAFAWWFRASNTKANYQPDFAYSGRIEFVTWSIPVLIILFLGGLTWIGSHDLDPARPIESSAKPMEIQVVSLDWKWLFIYPEQGVAAVNQLVVPKQTPIHFTLTSASVMNTFFIPQLGSMIYTMNGMATQLNLLADREGTYQGLSTHFSGDGFPGMHFEVRSTTKDGFEQWISSVRNSAEALDRKGYDALAEQSLDVVPVTYRTVEPKLFEDIVTQAIPPAPGPPGEDPKTSVSPKMGG